MAQDDEPEDDAPGFGAPLPPEDRLWRHPSEIDDVGWASSALVEATPPAGRAAPGPRVWTLAALSGLLGAALTIGVVIVVGGMPNGKTREVIERIPIEQAAQTTLAGEGGVVEIAQTLGPAITRVDVETSDGTASGSGVLFRSDGYLLTNAHVVDGAVAIIVVLATGEEMSGEVVGVDLATDVAVVKIEGEDFPIAVLGTAVELQVGQEAIAIGSPLGVAGGPSVTVGVVSALGRQVDSSTGEQLHDMIQTDAPIAPGSSGGALVNAQGVVVGVTTAIAVSEVGAESLGFATPIDLARTVAEDIIATGEAHHVWLGIEGTDLDHAAAQDLAVTGGARVHKVIAGSPAAAAGLTEDDVILSVEGKPVASMSALVVALRAHHPGDKVGIEYVRDGKRDTVTLTLTERPD